MPDQVSRERSHESSAEHIGPTVSAPTYMVKPSPTYPSTYARLPTADMYVLGSASSWSMKSTGIQTISLSLNNRPAAAKVGKFPEQCVEQGPQEILKDFS